ncbi:MAG: patatin-like phospholipase family protein [Micrococcales bacterium]|nr:patatin-like phospholipase family protein [Micrococcales bacterium]
MIDRAIVLSGGGLGGIAWEVGVLTGIRDAWPELDEVLADSSTLIVGTSAGSVVGSQVAAAVPLELLFEAQLAEQTAEVGARIDAAAFQSRIDQALAGATSPEDARRRIGAMAIAAHPEDDGERAEIIRSRLASEQWPERALRVAAVDADTGELVAFDRDSGVDLVSALAASCAVPGVWPVIRIGDRRFVDGGVRSGSNADLAAGAGRVLVLNPLPVEGMPLVPEGELEALGGAAVEIVSADAAALAIYGLRALDPAVSPAAARAGREQGRSVAGRVMALLA